MPNSTNQPQVPSGMLYVTGITGNSISIKWDPATDAKPDPYVYKVGLTEEENVYDPWHIVEEGKGFYSYTFTGLKPELSYAFFVKAYDGDELIRQYPLFNGCMTAKTGAVDKEAPTVYTKQITVTDSTRDSISIKWEAAVDNVTPKQNINYQVWFKLSNTPSDPWHLVREEKGITTHTFKNLKEETQYSFFVRAFDEAGNSLQYPLSNGCMTAKTKAGDKEAPTVDNKHITVTGTTRDSISIQWEAAADNVTSKANIRYEVWFKLSDTPSDPWHCVYEKNGITSYTFKGLKEGTKYSFFVRAFDDSGNSLQYPLSNGCMTARTAALDTVAPTVDSRALTAVNIKSNSFTIRWKAAMDDVTAASQILYEVYLYEKGNWWQKKRANGITSYTFTGLTPSTTYYVYVKAMDAVGNVLRYPNDTGSRIVKTKPAPVNKLNLTIEQGATVLRGTDTICVELTYNYVKYDADANIIGRQSGSWKRKWSSKNTVNTVIALPEGWYFEDNKVHIYIDSRRAASAGLNKWKKCCEGDEDISGGFLHLKLSGSYYSYSVKYTKV